ncbi:MAG: ABC transporter ATP-binding protein [Bryobacteraceae bacterium]
MLHLTNVTKRYGDVFALREINLSFAPGEFAALVGRSGCGKTTLLNLCGAMDFPTTGEVRIGGESTSQLDDRALTLLRRTRIGFVFQFFQLLPTLTVIENIELPALLAGRNEPRRDAEQLLGWVELDGLGARFPHQISGGQAQRVAIARALMNNPSVILADEPIGNLDTKTGSAVLALLRRAADDRGATVLMATHSRESTEFCDRVVRLRDGLVETPLEESLGEPLQENDSR